MVVRLIQVEFAMLSRLHMPGRCVLAGRLIYCQQDSLLTKCARSCLASAHIMSRWSFMVMQTVTCSIRVCARFRGKCAEHACMLAGALIASATDLTFSLYGYSAVIGNDFLTALYLILVKNTPATAGLTTTGLLFYNAALSLPILGFAVAFSSEPAGIAAYPDAQSWGFRVGCQLSHL